MVSRQRASCVVSKKCGWWERQTTRSDFHFDHHFHFIQRSFLVCLLSSSLSAPDLLFKSISLLFIISASIASAEVTGRFGN